MAEQYSITAILNAKVDNLVNGFKKATDTVDNFMKKNEKTFDNFKQVGATMTATGAVIGGALGGAVKIAADFESQMSKVGAISGATADDMELLSTKAREVGSSTKFSASESAEAFEFMALAGWKTSDMLDGIDGMMSLAAASGAELATVSDIVTDGLSMFGLEAKESARFADVLAAASANTNTNVEGMGEALKYVGASANAAGLSIEETSAFIGMLADNGIKGSSAGTAMNAVLRDMKSKSKDGALAIGKTSVAVYDAEGNMRSLSDILTDVEKGTEDMTVAQRDAALMAIFGDEAMRGVNIALSSGSEEMKRLEGVMNGAEGTAAKMAEVMQDNLNGAITNLKSGMEEMAISIGTALIPVIEKLVGFIQGLVNWFNGLSEGTKETIATIGLITAAFLLLVGPLFLLVGFIPSIMAGFTALSGVLAVLFSPITLIVAAVIALGAAFVIAYNKVEWFRDMVDVAWEWIKEIFFAALNFIKNNIVKPIMNEVASTINSVLTKVKQLWDKYGAQIMGVAQAYFQAVWAFIQGVMGWIQGLFQAVWPIISNIVKIAWEAIKTTVSNFTALIEGIIDTAMAIVQGDWEGAWISIKSTAEKIMNNIIDFFKSIDLVQTGKDIINGLIKGIGSMVGSVTSAVKSIGSSIKNGFKSFFKIASPAKEMVEDGGFITQGVAVGIEKMKHKAVKATERLGLGIQNAFAPQLEVDGISNQIRNLDKRASSNFSSQFNAQMNVTKQPIVVNVYDNKEAVRAYVNDNNALDAQIRRF